MSVVSKKLIAPFILLWVFAMLDTQTPPANLTGMVIAFAAVFVGIVISVAANQIVSELQETRQQLKNRDHEQSKETAESWK